MEDYMIRYLNYDMEFLIMIGSLKSDVQAHRKAQLDCIYNMDF